MTAEEKHIIEELLAGCSPTVQSIINPDNKFSIPPPFEEGENNASIAIVNQLYRPSDTNNVSISILASY